MHHRRRRATSPTTTTDAEEPAEHAVGEAEEPEVLVDAHQVTSHQLAAHADGSALLLQEVAVAVPGRAVAMQVRVPAPPSPPPTEVSPLHRAGVCMRAPPTRAESNKRGTTPTSPVH